MKIFSWTPALRYIDSERNGGICKVEGMSSAVAKSFSFNPRRFEQDKFSVNFDRYGHVACEILMDFRQNHVSSAVIDLILNEACITQKQFDEIDTLNAYVSWFPKMDLEGSGELLHTGRKMTYDEEVELLLPFDDSFEKLQAVKARVLNLFAKEYQAKANSKQLDFQAYGNLENHRMFQVAVENEQEVLKTIFSMMNTKIEGRSLVLSAVKPDATYYGLDILRECRLLSGRKYHQEGRPLPEHVCTTAILRIIRASIRKEKYVNLMREAAEENSTLFASLISIELINAVAEKISLSYGEKLTNSAGFLNQYKKL